MRKPAIRFTIFLLCSALFVGCRAEKRVTQDLRDETSQIQTTSEEVPASEESQTTTTVPPTIQFDQGDFELIISDDLLILDDSDGTANVYRIRFDSRCEPLQENDTWTSTMGVAPQYAAWFGGNTIYDEENSAYTPPAGIEKKTISNRSIVSVDDIENSQQLPDVENRKGHVFCITYDMDGFPDHLSLIYEHEFTSKEIKYYIVPPRIDGIQIGRSGYTDAPSYPSMIKWEGIYRDTLGISYETMERVYHTYLSSPHTFVYEDQIAEEFLFANYTILDTLMEDVPLVSAEEALQGAREAIAYQVYRHGIMSTEVYAMELVYLCASDYDMDTHTYPNPDEAILSPMWVIYFYQQDTVGNKTFNSALVNAVTGESMYSDTYSWEKALELQELCLD